MQAEIRPLAPEDVDDVVALAVRAWTPVFESLADVFGPALFEHFYGGDWRNAQAHDVRRACSEYRTWIAVVDAAVIAFTSVDLPDEGDQGEIYMIAVDPSHQGLGVGFELTNFAIDRIKEAGKKIAMVSTGGDPGHAAARATYERAGFIRYPATQYYKLL